MSFLRFGETFMFSKTIKQVPKVLPANFAEETWRQVTEYVVPLQTYLTLFLTSHLPRLFAIFFLTLYLSRVAELHHECVGSVREVFGTFRPLNSRSLELDLQRFDLAF